MKANERKQSQRASILLIAVVAAVVGVSKLRAIISEYQVWSYSKLLMIFIMVFVHQVHLN
jgi:hypothetical protein